MLQLREGSEHITHFRAKKEQFSMQVVMLTHKMLLMVPGVNVPGLLDWAPKVSEPAEEVEVETLSDLHRFHEMNIPKYLKGVHFFCISAADKW